jgi:zinc protease
MQKCFLVGLSLLGVAALALPAGAQQSAAPVLPPKLAVQTRTLANGLRLVMVEDHAVPVINLQVWYHVGSKNEQAGQSGFAHLFEHLMFKGSAHVGPEEHGRIIEALGGSDNAYTTDDVTVYFETFPSNYLDRVLWLEADRMGSLNVDQANFTAEREVVKEERRLRVDNRPYGLVQEDLYAAAFTVHPYHHTTIGSMEDLNKALLGDVQTFFQTYYRPNNATVVIVGDFSAADAVRAAEMNFGGIPASSQPIPRTIAPEPPQTELRRVTKSYANSPLPAVIKGFKMPARYQPDAYPLELASNILAQGESSRLYRALVYKERIALQSAGFPNFTEDPNLFWVFALMNQGHTPAEGEKSIQAILSEIKDQAVDPKELEKAQNEEISSFILGRQTGEAKAEALGQDAVIGGNPDLINTELERYLRVTPADIQRVARQYFVPQRETALVVEAPKPAN